MDGTIKAYGIPALVGIPGFEIKVIPKFDNNSSSQDHNLYFDTILRQKNFLDTLFSLFQNNIKGCSCHIELRLVSRPKLQQVVCYVLFMIKNTDTSLDERDLGNEIDRLKTELDRIFPKDYLIKEISPLEIDTLLKLNPEYTVTEIIKTPKLLTVGTVSDSDEIVIADRYASDHHDEAKYLIPCSSHLQPKGYNFFNFYRLLMDVDYEAQVRISIGGAEIFEIEKSIAANYQNMIRKSYGSTANPEIQNYLTSFGKYLSANELFSLKLQVSCATEWQSLEVANSFCSQITYGEINTTSHLKCYPLTSKSKNYVGSDWTLGNHYYYNLASQKHQTKDSDVTSFIKRQSYLYDAAELMAVFRLPISDEKGLPGFIAKQVRPFFLPGNYQNTAANEIISFGNIERSIGDLDPIKYSLSIRDLPKHGLIVGATGSGKTNTTLNFVRELDKKGVSFLLIEPVKSEYYKELLPHIQKKTLKRFNVKNPWDSDGSINKEFLKINPFMPLDGISLHQHISYIKGCITAAFPMYGISSHVLEACLISLYRKAVDENDKAMFLTTLPPHYQKSVNELSFESLLAAIIEYLNYNDSFDAEEALEMTNFLTRRIEKFTTGVLGHIFCPRFWGATEKEQSAAASMLSNILEDPTIIELEHLPENGDKALIMAFILTYMFEHRQKKPSIKQLEVEEGINFDPSRHIHVTIIEEAHRLLSYSNISSATGNGEHQSTTMDAKSASISLFIDMLAEIRSKGEGIFIVEQIPTKLVSDVVKNTNLKIMHRITSKDDRNYLGEAMNMNEVQKNYVSTLKTGEAIVFEEHLDNPVFIKMDPFNELKYGN